MNRNEEEILEQFETLKPQLNVWGRKVDETLISIIIKDMICENLIKILPSFRLKDDKSYLFKALYRKKNYSNPIEKIEDKVGTRIVVLKSDDIKVIQQRILDYPGWESKLTKNFDQEIEDQPKNFDYQSCHIVVKPIDDNDMFDKKHLNSLSCEIQIRTLLQHAFAEVSHDSTYKGPYRNDKEIMRRLAKSMALMEATDDYFCNIFSMITDEKRYYSQYLSELISLFQQFKSDFYKRELDIFITENILGLLDLKEVSLTDLEAFTIKHQPELKKIIQPKNGLLFQQPTILLSLYYFYCHRTFMRENWPLNNEVLKRIYKITGTAFEEY